jgi:acetyl/propionyl-CoA carboxylase alpha subunit
VTRLRCGDEVFDARVRAEDDGVSVTLAGRSLRLVLEPLAPGIARVDDGVHPRLLHYARDGGRLYLFWDGVAYELQEEREGWRPEKRHSPSALEAPMPGRVSVLRVSPGQRVGRGEELLVIEAMKMENALRAPRDGVVRAVHVAVGELVAPGRALVELEA